MRAWKNAKLLLFIYFLWGWLVSSPLYADEFAAQIKSARLENYEGWYVLNADVEYILSPKANAAIQSSIPLFWQVKIRLKRERYFKDKTLVSITYRYRIRYHALLNNYSVKNETTHTLKKYASLSEALDSLSRIRELKIIAVSDLDKNKVYKMAMRVEFDKESLPPPLRPAAYLSSQWDLSSEWFLWPVQP